MNCTTKVGDTTITVIIAPGKFKLGREGKTQTIYLHEENRTIYFPDLMLGSVEQDCDSLVIKCPRDFAERNHLQPFIAENMQSTAIDVTVSGAPDKTIAASMPVPNCPRCGSPASARNTAGLNHGVNCSNDVCLLASPICATYELAIGWWSKQWTGNLPLCDDHKLLANVDELELTVLACVQCELQIAHSLIAHETKM